MWYVYSVGLGVTVGRWCFFSSLADRSSQPTKSMTTVSAGQKPTKLPATGVTQWECVFGVCGRVLSLGGVPVDTLAISSVMDSNKHLGIAAPAAIDIAGERLTVVHRFGGRTMSKLTPQTHEAGVAFK